VICLTKALARALAGSGVTVTTINPGPVEGPMVEAWPPGQRQIQLERTPVGRFGRPEEIAAAVFLASKHAGYIHGTHLDVNGGLPMD
jgi:NAD(P)-dependent dehydrogenase (short-subunit alcohol dehydrogenase family)